MMTLKERINEIKSLNNNECWYITKQSLSFIDLCFAAKILEEFINSVSGENYENFFNRKATEYSIQKNYRMTNNCYYLGLLEQNGLYKDAKLTDVYLEIKKRCSGNFHKQELYEDILVSQIEKVFISNPVDEEHKKLRKNYRIHPALFLAKVLIELGDITKSYTISLSEFKVFVGTSFNYNYHISTTSLILEGRVNSSIHIDLSYIDNFYQDIKSIDDSNFGGNRLNLLLNNLPYFIIDDKNLSLDTSYLTELRYKIFSYECEFNNDNIFTTNYLNSINKFTDVNSKNVINDPSNTYEINKYTSSNQIIFFGPPGTGKSFKIDTITQDQEVRKVTFHPEYDYNNFVGGYKPTMNINETISYKFVPQIFTKIYIDAWNHPEKIFYLQIEEINRGNCAEIFGDLFQLLDRDINGYSRYAIDAEEELRKFLIDNKGDGFKSETHPGIKNGKLNLPSNLKFIATMNTSDQSLFPMDTAFKRRWDWEYVPINYKCEKSNFIILLDNSFKFKWLDFLKNINELIFNTTNSEDKQIGNWFVVAHSSDLIITESVFLNKVLFYLWNDIFKEEENTIFRTTNFPHITYATFFEFDDRSNIISEILIENLKLSTIN